MIFTGKAGVHALSVAMIPAGREEALVCFHDGKRYFFHNSQQAVLCITANYWTNYELRPLTEAEQREAWPE